MAAFDGIRVLDFGRYVSGPYCATLMADFGADVIRIERPGGGEDRFIGPVAESGDGRGVPQLARNKRCMTFNPRAEGAGEVLRRLVASADVVVANVPANALQRMGIELMHRCRDQARHNPCQHLLVRHARTLGQPPASTRSARR